MEKPASLEPFRSECSRSPKNPEKDNLLPTTLRAALAMRDQGDLFNHLFRLNLKLRSTKGGIDTGLIQNARSCRRASTNLNWHQFPSWCECFIRRLHFVEVLWGSSMHFVDKTWSNMIKLYWISQFHLHLIHSHYAMICIYIAKVQREEARWTGSGEKWACLPDKSKPVGPLEGPCSSGTKGYAASRIPTREADDSWPWNIRTFFHLFSSLLCLFRAARWSLNVHEHAM